LDLLQDNLGYIFEWSIICNDDSIDLDDFNKYFPENARVKFYAGHGNIGFGRGHNLALLVNQSEYFLIINPDIELEEDALKKAICCMRSNSNIGMLSPQVCDANGNLQYLCKNYPSLFYFSPGVFF
jgi:hypothetical protein